MGNTRLSGYGSPHDDDDFSAGASHGYGRASKGGSSSHGVDFSKGGDTEIPGFDNAKVIGDDGRFMGVPLSPSAATSARFILQQFLPELSAKVETGAERWVRDNLKAWRPHMSADAVGKAAEHWGGMLGWLTIGAEPIANVAGALLSTASSLNQLRAVSAPIFRAYGDMGADVKGLFTSGTNEMLEDKRNWILSAAKQRFVDIGARSVSYIIPIAQKMAARAERTKKFHEEEEVRRYAEATPEERAKMLRDKVGTAWKDKLAMEESWKLTEKALREEHAKEFTAWKEGNVKDASGKSSDALVKELKQKFKKDLEEYITEHNEIARAGGNSYDRLNELNKRYDSRIRDFAQPKKVENKQNDAFSAFSDHGKRNEIEKRPRFENSSQWKNYEEQKLKEYYATEIGKPLDVGDLPPDLRNNSDARAGTKMAAARKYFDEAMKQEQEHLRGLHDKAKSGHSGHQAEGLSGKTIDHGLRAGGTILGEVAGNLLGTKGMEQFKHALPFDYVMHLKQVIQEAQKNGKSPPEEIPGLEFGGKREQAKSYAAFVDDLIDLHQRIHGRPIVNKRFKPHFDEARFDDRRIAESSARKEWTPYEELVWDIAHNLKSGNLDPCALFALLGDRKTRLVGDDGMTFGVSGMAKNSTDEDRKKSIRQEVDKWCVCLGGEQAVDASKLSETTGELMLTEKELKPAFADGGLKGDELYVMYGMLRAEFPNQEVLCKLTGLSPERCAALDKESSAHMAGLVNAAVKALDTMVEKAPESLEALHIDKDDKRLLHDISEKAGETRVDANDVVKDKTERTRLHSMVMRALLNVKGFWAQVAEAKVELAEEEAAAEKEKPKERHKKSPPRDDEYTGARADDGTPEEVEETTRHRDANPKKGRHALRNAEKAGLDPDDYKKDRDKKSHKPFKGQDDWGAALASRSHSGEHEASSAERW